jgi:hypothetical protein
LQLLHQVELVLQVLLINCFLQPVPQALVASPLPNSVLPADCRLVSLSLLLRPVLLPLLTLLMASQPAAAS